MNVALWIVQALLAVHTAMGAVWKFSNAAGQAVPSLKAIPQGAWLTMAVVELLCAVALVLPAAYRPLAILAPVAATLIAVEMVLFCALHLQSGEAGHGQMVYWLVVAAVCAFVAYGRFVLRPL
jgi:hypothetical protein